MKTIRFESQEHENFFYSMLRKTGNTDSYHQAFFYCVGISDTTRRNVERIFDFKQGHIRPEGLQDRRLHPSDKACLQSLEWIYGE